MKKHLFPLISALLLLTLVLSACGAQSGNSGPTADGNTSGKTTTVTLHSGGCWTHDGTLASHADLAENTDPPRWATGGSPFFGAQIIACQDVVYLSWTTGFDFYQVRWARPGINQQQFSTSNQGSINFTNAHFNTTYTFILEGCNHGFWGSNCTKWSPTVSVATYYPN